MQKLDQQEILLERGTVPDQNFDLANVGEGAGLGDRALPAEVPELAGKRRFEIAALDAKIRPPLELRFGHHRLRQHRGSCRLLSANHGLHALMLQSEQAEQRDPEDRNRDHHLEQRKSACAVAKRVHRDVVLIPCGITSPLRIATWPVSGENSSVITSPDASSRCTTVAST